MNAMAGGGVGPLSTEDEEAIEVSDVAGVEALLAAERDLLDDMIAAAQAAVNGNTGSVSQFLQHYWLAPLQGDRDATAIWLRDLQHGHIAQVREAAREEQQLARFLGRLVRGLAAEPGITPTLQSALDSYANDFRTEMNGKNPIINGLP